MGEGVRVTVVCTGKGRHGRIELQPFEVHPDGTIVEVTVRTAASPGTRTDAGEALSTRALVPAPSTRDDHAGRRRYRFTCPRCPVDRPMLGETVDSAVRGLASASLDVLDVSRLPR